MEPLNPEQVFGAFRSAIGIPADQPIENWAKYDVSHGEGTYGIHSVPGGFQAALDMWVCPSGQPVCDCKYEHEDGHCWREDEPYYIQIVLDTTYGGPSCPMCRHLGIIRQAISGITTAVRFNNEMTDHWWEGEYPERCDLGNCRGMNEPVLVA